MIVVRQVALLACAALTLLSGMGVEARAETSTAIECELTPMAGRWKTTDPQSETLVTLEVIEKCERMATQQEGETRSDSPWSSMLKVEKKYVYREFTVRAFDKCYPANCIWGRVKGERRDNGSVRAVFKLFWSQRFLEIFPTSDDDTLRVRFRYEYFGRKKPDQTGELVMVRDN